MNTSSQHSNLVAATMDVFSRMKMLNPIILQALGAIAMSITCIFVHQWLQNDVQSKFWKSQHKVGIRGRWFSWTLATLRSLKGTKEMAVEGYQKVWYSFVRPVTSCAHRRAVFQA
jgi:hypothetical protein